MSIVSNHYIHIFPLHLNPLETGVELVLQNHSHALPDLGELTVLIPNGYAIESLHASFLRAAQKRGYAALIGPRIATLSQWAEQYTPPDASKPLVAARAQAILVQEIKKHRWLYGTNNPWHFAEELLHLFNELDRTQLVLPTEASVFASQLTMAYGLPESQKTPALQEANVIFTLWQAWRQQLQAEQQQGSVTRYHAQLQNSLQHPRQMLYLLAYTQLSPAEHHWAETLLAQNKLQLILFGTRQEQSSLPVHGLLNASAEHSRSHFYNACFDINSDALITRAQTFKRRQPSNPIKQHLKLLRCSNAEQHAQAIVLAIKRARLAGSTRIGIVSEDRRLARRLRALLERENLALHDAPGWALSTTRAAATLESWLQCIEEDFPYQAFLDVLKSPFFQFSDSPEDDRQLVYRFEQDIIRHENISSGIARYRQTLQYRSERLLHWGHKYYQQLQQVLHNFAAAAAELHKLRRARSATLSDYLSYLQQSLQQIGILPAMQQDAAGVLLSEMLQKLCAAASELSAEYDWLDFRNWLGRAMESEYFAPEQTHRQISLVNMQQSYLLPFDYLIVASADEQHLPGKVNASPFFNQIVRSALKLEDWQTLVQHSAHRFRALLERYDNILISWQEENNGEALAPSPWICAIENFHQACYAESLDDTELYALVRAQWQNFQHDCIYDLQAPQQASPACPNDWLPDRLNISALQQLINCPYQFFAAQLLELQPEIEIRETLQKSDYGNRIHLCLQAFHSNIPHLPGPFSVPLTEENRNAACTLLKHIAEAVFKRDIEDNFQHRAWLQRWLQRIPDYIDWEIQHAREWRVIATEQTLSHAQSGHTLYGRIDRIDQHHDVKALLDYKTGTPPHKRDILNGEDIQLGSYALMLENVVRIEYLHVDDKSKIASRNIIAAEDLSQLREALQQRNEMLIDMLSAGHSMPAWPGKQCDYCSYAGLCRHRIWESDMTKV